MIRALQNTDKAKAFRDFICELIDENTYLLVDKKPTMKEERKWLSEKKAAIKNKKEVAFTAWDGDTLIGICDARKGQFKQKDNVLIGIALRKNYRGQGLGEKLLRITVTTAKKTFKPKNIYLEVFSDNRIAQKLYKKVGFRIFARFPKWVKHNNRYMNVFYMILKN